MYFDASVVFVTKSPLLFRLAVAILWRGIVPCFPCHSHRALCNVYPSLSCSFWTEVEGKNFWYHYNYDRIEIRSFSTKIGCELMCMTCDRSNFLPWCKNRKLTILKFRLLFSSSPELSTMLDFSFFSPIWVSGFLDINNLKFKYSEKATKIWKNLPLSFDINK